MFTKIFFGSLALAAGIYAAVAFPFALTIQYSAGTFSLNGFQCVGILGFALLALWVLSFLCSYIGRLVFRQKSFEELLILYLSAYEEKNVSQLERVVKKMPTSPLKAILSFNVASISGHAESIERALALSERYQGLESWRIKQNILKLTAQKDIEGLLRLLRPLHTGPRLSLYAAEKLVGCFLEFKHVREAEALLPHVTHSKREEQAFNALKAKILLEKSLEKATDPLERDLLLNEAQTLAPHNPKILNAVIKHYMKSDQFKRATKFIFNAWKQNPSVDFIPVTISLEGKMNENERKNLRDILEKKNESATWVCLSMFFAKEKNWESFQKTLKPLKTNEPLWALYLIFHFFHANDSLPHDFFQISFEVLLKLKPELIRFTHH